MAEPFSESWFHAPSLRAAGDTCALSGDESHHLRKVLRIPLGGEIIASNGMGAAFVCHTRDAGQAVEATAREMLVSAPEPPRLNMVLGLLKGRDLEEPAEALSQLEIHRIFLVTSDHSQEFKGQDHARLLERLRAKSLVGLKQAKKAWLTEIVAPVPLRAWRAVHTALPLVVAAPGADRGLPAPGTAFALAVGPEGGFSAAETAWFAEQGCGTLALGPTRIRGMHAPLLAAGKLMGLGLA